MLLVLPRSTLFPYTTLFRSSLVVQVFPINHKENLIHFIHLSRQSRSLKTGQGLTRPRRMPDIAASLKAARLDRKSTRLNSSHVSISYAVFCLKKKTTQKDLR